jgi:hypothetical protein
MSDSNQERVSFVEEVTRGTTPSANLQEVVHAGHSLLTTPSTTRSGSIRTDGNNRGDIRNDMVPGGGVNTELIHENCDKWIESAFRSEFDSQISLSGTTFSVDASGSPITLDDSGSGLGDLKPNDLIIVSGFTTAGNNGVFLVGGNTAAGSVDIIAVDPDATPATEVAGDSVTINTTRLQNALTPKFFSIQSDNSDSGIFRAFKGMEVASLVLSFQAGNPITANFTFTGKEESKVSSTIGTGYTAASTADIIDMENGYVGTLVGINGAASASAPACVTGATYTITNTARRTKGANCVSFGNGMFLVEVSLTMMFSEKTIYDAFLDNQSLSITSAAKDSSGQGYGITVPNLQGLQVSPPVQGLDSDIIATVTGTSKFYTAGSDTYSSILSKLG